MQASEVLPHQICSSMFLCDLLCALVRSHIEGPSPNCPHKVKSKSWYVEALRDLFSGTKGLSTMRVFC